MTVASTLTTIQKKDVFLADKFGTEAGHSDILKVDEEESIVLVGFMKYVVHS